MSASCFTVSGKHGVDQSEQLHHTFVLPQVFMTFKKESVFLAVATEYTQFPRSLFGGDHAQRQSERSDLDHLIRFSLIGAYVKFCTRLDWLTKEII